MTPVNRKNGCGGYAVAAVSKLMYLLRAPLKYRVVQRCGYFIANYCQNDEVILTYNKEFWQEVAVKDWCIWAAIYF